MTIPRDQPMKRQNDSTLSAWPWGLHLLDGDRILSYAFLLTSLRKGLRNGNWTMLDNTEKALFRCALWVTKTKGKISNMKLVVQVLSIAPKIFQTIRRIGRAGRMRATMMLQEFAKSGGVFTRAPRVRGWLHDPQYQTYLALEVNT